MPFLADLLASLATLVPVDGDKLAPVPRPEDDKGRSLAAVLVQVGVLFDQSVDDGLLQPGLVFQASWKIDLIQLDFLHVDPVHPLLMQGLLVQSISHNTSPSWKWERGTSPLPYCRQDFLTYQILPS